MATIWTNYARIRWERETILDKWTLIIDFETDAMATEFETQLNDQTAIEFSYTVFTLQRTACGCKDACGHKRRCGATCSNPLLVEFKDYASSLPVQRNENVVRIENLFADDEALDIDLNQDWRNGTVAVPQPAVV